MVRKAIVVTLAFLGSMAVSAENPYYKYLPEGTIWNGSTTSNENFWILEKEIDYSSYLAGGVQFWMHGNHANNPKVKYRTSMWKIRMDCKGYMTVSARSHIDANGVSVNEWDGYGKPTSIRPNTIYEEIQDKLCPK